MKADLDAMAEMVPKANAAGVRLVLGDDYGAIFFPHGDYADELAFYVDEIGIPSVDVIRWATRHGAELMGRDHELGTVAEGKLADLLVVDGDPLADVAVLKDKTKLLAIVKGGKLLKDQLPDVLSPRAQPN
jgi:imidazolonepropionase-like amidohydrolase